MTSKARKIQAILDKWTKENGFEANTVVFYGWEPLTSDKPNTTVILGRCHYHSRPNLWCHIYLGIKFQDRKLGWLEESVLWHEFCHAQAFLEDGISDSHNNHWFDLTWRKPWFVIGDWVAKILYWVM